MVQPVFPQIYTIQQVSDHLKVSKHTLRYWEKALDGVIAPLRTKGGQRRYTLKHLVIIEEIKRLKRKGLTLSEIRNEMNLERPGKKTAVINPDGVDFIAEKITEAVRSVVYNMLEGKGSSMDFRGARWK